MARTFHHRADVGTGVHQVCGEAAAQRVLCGGLATPSSTDSYVLCAVRLAIFWPLMSVSQCPRRTGETLPYETTQPYVEAL